MGEQAPPLGSGVSSTTGWASLTTLFLPLFLVLLSVLPGACFYFHFPLFGMYPKLIYFKSLGKQRPESWHCQGHKGREKPEVEPWPALICALAAKACLHPASVLFEISKLPSAFQIFPSDLSSGLLPSPPTPDSSLLSSLPTPPPASSSHGRPFCLAALQGSWIRTHLSTSVLTRTSSRPMCSYIHVQIPPGRCVHIMQTPHVCPVSDALNITGLDTEDYSGTQRHNQRKHTKKRHSVISFIVNKNNNTAAAGLYGAAACR